MKIIRYTERSIHLHQLNKANKLTSKFNLMDTKVLSTPINKPHDVDHNLTTSDNQFPYRQSVGNCNNLQLTALYKTYYFYHKS